MNLREVAQSLRIDPSTLENGQVVDTSVAVPDVETFRKLFGGTLSDEQRAAFSAAAPDLEEHPQMKALTHHVFGSGDLDDDARAYARQVLPANVRVMLGDTVTINSDIVQGPSGQPYAIVTDNLVFDGGSLTMQATALTINAGTVTVKSGSPTNPYHIGIMGVAGTQPAQAAAGSPYANAAQAGSNSSAPTPGICTGASDGGTGTAGSKGNVGNPGNTGNTGLASYPAAITVTSFDPASASALVVQTQSGAGGAGGQGGNGGQGQTGGQGGNGCDSGCEGTDGGNGGAAGQGGDGGPGGNGANGVNGYPSSISFPNASKQMLQTVSVSAPPGAAGPGGSGGPAGYPGGGGSGGKHKSDGQSGGGASGGTTGANGTAGTIQGAPGQISFTWT